MYKKSEYSTIKSRLEEARKFIQVVMGPRQIGKSTVVKQVLQDLDAECLFFSADNVPASNGNWISDCWESARVLLQTKQLSSIVLVIDEIQKIRNWSESVKKEWDADSFTGRNIKVLLLGSSRVMLERGLSESLAGRFEEIRMTHWTFAEMRDCFGWTLEQFIFFGAYPGAATLVGDEERFQQYIQAAIVDATINKDILMDAAIGKPALFRQTCELATAYSGELLSLTKMLGSLQDAGNTATLAGYLNLLGDAGMVRGLQKFSVDTARTKSSIPKFQVFNNALKTLFSTQNFEQSRLDHKNWGRILESAVGAYLVSQAFVRRFEVFYWRERDLEVDFVLRKKGVLVAIEVKSNSAKKTAGLEKFKQLFSPHKAFVVGPDGVPVDEFLQMDLDLLFK